MIKTSLKFQLSVGRANGIEIDPTRLPARESSVSRTKTHARSCDYDAPAGLYIRQGSRLRYQGFARTSLAVRYANEELSARQLLSCTMEVGDDRYLGPEVQALYRSGRYPLRHGKATGT